MPEDAAHLRSDWYAGKVILAPMVRVTNLPFRLLAARSGADVVYTEELIAQKVMKTHRRVDPARGMVEYVLTEQHGKAKKRQLMQTLVYATLQRSSRAEHPEGAPVVMQLGASEPAAAVAAARHVERDVDGIDLNMGCPKAFSIKGGMGAALLTDKERACKILSELVAAVSVPVTAKVRMLEDVEESRELLRAIAATGVKAVTVHARFRDSRYTVGPFYDHLEAILAGLPNYPVPLVFNGDVDGKEGAFATPGARIPQVRGVMIARGALQNPTCFLPKPLPKKEAYAELLKLFLKYKGGMRDVKYTLSRSFQEHKEFVREHEKITKARSIPEMWEALGKPLDDPEFQQLLAAYVDPMAVIDGTMEEFEVSVRAAGAEADGAPPAKRARCDAGDGDGSGNGAAEAPQAAAVEAA